nr:hypothetical protein [Leucobacter weissii]
MILAVLVVAGAVAMIVPILTHQSAGGSGQEVPDGFVSETEALGADGRTRELSVETADGRPADLARIRPGDLLVVHGSGFDADIGIYVAVCLIPSIPGEKPSPCLGGVPEGAMEEDGPGGADAEPSSSVWITDAWAWRAFATQGWDDAATGSFTARLLVPESAQDGLDCSRSACAVTTRADHTASADRVQDMQLPVSFDR